MLGYNLVVLRETCEAHCKPFINLFFCLFNLFRTSFNGKHPYYRTVVTL